MPVTLQTRSAPRAEGHALFTALLECHERIRRFAQLAVTIARGPDAPASEVREAAAGVLRYFTVALPLHVADEDLSFELRLTPIASPPVREALARMRAEHVVIEGALAELVPEWTKLATSAEAPSPWLRDRSEALAGLFERHLVAEENQIFPEAREKLDAATCTLILEELRERRRA